MRRFLLLGTITSIFALAVHAQGPAPGPAALKPVVWPPDVRIEHEVAYLPAVRAEKADLYFPLVLPKDCLLPAVVIIHGGGFNDGDKASAREISTGRSSRSTATLA